MKLDRKSVRTILLIITFAVVLYTAAQNLAAIYGAIATVWNIFGVVITGLAMAFEMAAYGMIAGALYKHSKWQCVVALYRSLLIAMVGGRIVWGAVMVVLSGVSGQAFTWQLFLSGAFLTAIPGIILQLVFIPALMVALDRTGMVRFARKTQSVQASN